MSQRITKEPPTKLLIETLKSVPKSPEIRRTKNGDTLVMHYTGTLFQNGEKFDSSLDRNKPFTFTLGSGEVIKGWDRGLTDMAVGEERRLTIPPHFGYGQSQVGPIPANSTLVFEVKLLEIRDTTDPLSFIIYILLAIGVGMGLYVLAKGGSVPFDFMFNPKKNA